MARPKRTVPWLAKRGDIYYAYWPRQDSPKPGSWSLGTTEAGEAQDRFAAYLINRDVITDTAETSKDITVKKILSDYKIEHIDEPGKVAETTADRFDSCQKNLNRFFGTAIVKDIGILNCRQYKKARNSGQSGHKSGDSTVRRELADLESAIGHAVRWKRLNKSDAPFIEKPKQAPPKDRWLTNDELKRLMENASGRTLLFIQLAYWTASRKQALHELTWFQVKFEDRKIHLNALGRKQTSKKRPTVPLVAQLLPILHSAKTKASTPWVLETSGDTRTGFYSACERAGLKKVTRHTLRHTRAVHLAQSGVRPYVIAGLLGDTTATVEANYLHHCPDHIRAEIESNKEINTEDLMGH